MNATTWTHADMIAATIEWFEDEALADPDDFEVVADEWAGEPCLLVVHRPTGRTSTEAGRQGCWHPDGRAMI